MGLVIQKGQVGGGGGGGVGLGGGGEDGVGEDGVGVGDGVGLGKSGVRIIRKKKLYMANITYYVETDI